MIIYDVFLLTIAILPVVLLMIYIYRQDKYEKEPISLLMLTFFGGMLAIPLDFLLVYIIEKIIPPTDTPLYTAFLQAGIPEELSKFVILMLIIWRNKNFNEYMDGIVYATFLGLGFALVENIGYVFDVNVGGLDTGIMRAILSVPGHFLFAVIMGYFLSLAKFNPKRKVFYLACSYGLATLAHSLFDWLIMVSSEVSVYVSGLIMLAFIVFDLVLWKIGLKYIHKHQCNSQFCDNDNNDNNDNTDTNDTNNCNFNDSDNSIPEYKRIDWDAGRRL